MFVYFVCILSSDPSYIGRFKIDIGVLIIFEVVTPLYWALPS